MTELARPRVRGSSNQQDATDSTVEMAVRTRPPRSIPKALEVRAVAPSVVRPLIEGQHYLHSMPAAPCRCFGVYLGGELQGAVVLTAGARHGYRVLAAADPQHVVTLARLWLSDALPTNSESRVIGVVLRSLRHEARWKVVLSYADPAAGHVGTIYQATGWLYLGQSVPTTYIRLADGRLYHPRSLSERLGSDGVGHLRATGIQAARQPVSGKFKYVYLLDRTWGWRLRGLAQRYPRAGKAA